MLTVVSTLILNQLLLKQQNIVLLIRLSILTDLILILTI